MIPLELRALALSPFGDCFIIAERFLSLWTKDRAASFAYSTALAYGKDLPKDAYAPAKKEADTGVIDKVVFSPDARVFATLEDHRQVCVYYNADLAGGDRAGASLEDPYPQAIGSFASIDDLERVVLPKMAAVDDLFFLRASPLTIVTASRTEWNLFVEDTSLAPDFADVPPPHPSCKSSLFSMSHHARVANPGMTLRPICFDDRSEMKKHFEKILLPSSPMLFGKVADTSVRRKLIEAERVFDSM
jgi:hypothetical protein